MNIVELQDRNILVVEDDYMIAQDVRKSLEEAGAIVVGPVPLVAKALRLIDSRPDIDAAVLNVNLGPEDSFPIAAALQVRQVPFLFATGYDSADIPATWRHVNIATKPLRLHDVAALLSRSNGL